MKMEKEMKYVAPEVEVLEVAIEAGFAASDEFPVNPPSGTDGPSD